MATKSYYESFGAIETSEQNPAFEYPSAYEKEDYEIRTFSDMDFKTN